jgi:ankyrin repeat protein
VGHGQSLANTSELTVFRLVACLSPQAVTDVLGPKMDELRRMIKEMRIEQPDQFDTVEVNMMQHAKTLQSTAQFFVSRQATLVAHDDDDWMRISRNSTGLSKLGGKGADASEWEDVIDSDEEMEADLSANLLDEGITLCDQGKYREAESTLKNSIQDVMRKKLLGRHRAKVKQAQLKLGVAYLWQGKFESADPVLRGVAALPTDVDGMDGHLPLTLDAYYNLAQISLAYHDYTAALRDCQKCVKDRKKLFGKENSAYVHALILLVLIQRTSGDQASANAYSKQIPESMQSDRKGIAVLKYSCEGSHLSVQEEMDAVKLLEESPGNHDSTGGQNLRWAAFQGHISVVRLMLYRGAPLESGNFDGGTALNLAAGGGHPEIVELLIKKGANVNNNFPKKPPIHNAILTDAAECVRLLLDNGAKLEGEEGEVESDFSTVMSAAYHGSDRCLKLLLEAGARADVWNKAHHRSALMYAAREEKVHATQMLLKAGAMVNSIDKEGQSPLVFAVDSRNLEIVRLLLDHGASPDPPRDAPKFAPTALAIAARIEDLKIAKMLLAKGADPNRLGRSGLGPLVPAAEQQNSPAAVRLLLDHGANPNKQVFNHKRGATPLYQAINNENEETVKLLLDAGADVNQVSYENCSPLDSAQRRRMENVAELLFDKGATLEGNVEDEKDKTMVRDSHVWL